MTTSSKTNKSRKDKKEKIDDLKRLIKGMKEDIEVFGGCSEDYIRLGQWGRKLKELEKDDL
jgi:hypothetical protein